MRNEFKKETKREALIRSKIGDKKTCEAVGEIYGLPAGQRCDTDLAYGVEFDHFDLDANSKDNSLANCRAVCIPCHRFKTRHHDIPKAAKTVRQRDKNDGIRKGSSMPGSRNSKWKKKMDGSVVAR